MNAAAIVAERSRTNLLTLNSRRRKEGGKRRRTSPCYAVLDAALSDGSRGLAPSCVSNKGRVRGKAPAGQWLGSQGPVHVYSDCMHSLDEAG